MIWFFPNLLIGDFIEAPVSLKLCVLTVHKVFWSITMKDRQKGSLEKIKGRVFHLHLYKVHCQSKAFFVIMIEH